VKGAQRGGGGEGDREYTVTTLRTCYPFTGGRVSLFSKKRGEGFQLQREGREDKSLTPKAPLQPIYMPGQRKTLATCSYYSEKKEGRRSRNCFADEKGRDLSTTGAKGYHCYLGRSRRVEKKEKERLLPPAYEKKKRDSLSIRGEDCSLHWWGGVKFHKKDSNCTKKNCLPFV